MKELLEIHENGVTLGGKDFYIASGDMHYFRFFKEGWRRRLELMRDFGLTCVQTYVPWNMHEPEEGVFDFSGNLNIAEFIRLCDEVGLKVMLRPSPYMCGEWDMGGLPWWLLKNADVKIRCSDESHMKYVRRYTKRLCEEFVPLLSTNGGPIIAVAVENEYGSFGNDSDYIREMVQILKDNGVDVPLYSADGDTIKHITWGSLPELWTGFDSREGSENAKTLIQSFSDKKRPPIMTEQWAGCAQQWGGVFNRQSVEEASRHYKKSLELGFYVNFYMFCGGTNFGFMNGANFGVFRADVPHAKLRYIPFTTSYDVDAPVNEYGEPTEKYYALKKILAEYLGKEYKEEEPVKVKTASYGKAELTSSAPFFGNEDAASYQKILSKATKTMEEVSQGYGFILYETFLEPTDTDKRTLRINDLHDRATVYADGKYLGTMYRDRDDEVSFTIPKGGMKLQILVENMGRICYGLDTAYERKGITRCVHLDRYTPAGTRYHDFSMLMNWTIRSINLEDMSKISYSGNVNADSPAFYTGSFKAPDKADTFVKIIGGTKGVIKINGFNIGRYWNVGPQETLYVPAELLKNENTIEIFELYAPGESLSVEFSDKPSLDSIKQNIEALVQAERA